MTVVSQFGRMCSLEKIGQERSLFRNGQDQVDLFVHDELVDRLHKIEDPDEIEFRVEVAEHFFQFVPFHLVFFGQFHIMLAVHVDHMQVRLE